MNDFLYLCTCHLITNKWMNHFYQQLQINHNHIVVYRPSS